jgi:hypothetical protein
MSRAVYVFKRCSKKGDLPPLWVSEGGPEHGDWGDFPTYADRPRRCRTDA